MEYDGNRSLADEILDELYGCAPVTDEDREDEMVSPEYCNIDDIRSHDGVQGDYNQEDDNDFQSVGVTRRADDCGVEAKNPNVVGKSNIIVVKLKDAS